MRHEAHSHFNDSESQIHKRQAIRHINKTLHFHVNIVNYIRILSYDKALNDNDTVHRSCRNRKNISEKNML